MLPTIAFDYNTAGSLTQPQACYYSENYSKNIQERGNLHLWRSMFLGLSGRPPVSERKPLPADQSVR